MKTITILRKILIETSVARPTKTIWTKNFLTPLIHYYSLSSYSFSLLLQLLILVSKLVKFLLTIIAGIIEVIFTTTATIMTSHLKNLLLMTYFLLENSFLVYQPSNYLYLYMNYKMNYTNYYKNYCYDHHSLESY